MGHIQAIICIFAYNESQELSDLFQDLRNGHNKIPTLVVSDGSTDDTEMITMFNSHYGIFHPERRGIAESVKDAITKARSLRFDSALFISADAHFRDYHSIESLIIKLNYPQISATTCNQIPVRQKNGTWIAYHVDELIWSILRESKSIEKTKGGSSYLGGTCYAFKLDGIEPISGVINDDESLDSQLRAKGRVLWCPEAIIYFDASVSINHVLERRKRMYLGHLQNKSSNAPSRHVGLMAEAFWFSMLEKPSRVFFAPIAIMIEIYAHLWAQWVTFSGKQNHYIRWVSAKHK